MTTSSSLDKPQPFDPTAAVNAIRDKIRGAMLDIIPTEQWDALIRAEMTSFMTDRVERRQYGEDVRHEAEFKKIVRDILRENAEKQVRTLLDQPEWQMHFNGQAHEASDQIKELVLKHSGEILSNWIGMAMQNVVMMMRSQPR